MLPKLPTTGYPSKADKVALAPYQLMTKRSAFTLIELLVVVAIIAFAVGIVIPSFSAFTGRRRLVEASREVKSTIKDAQSRALSSIDGDNWGVHFVQGSDSFELFSFYGGLEGFSYSSARKEAAHTLPSGVRISTLQRQGGGEITIPVNVIFSVLKGIVYFSADSGWCWGGSEESVCCCGSDRCLSIGLQSSGQTRYIIVNERNIYESATACP